MKQQAELECVHKQFNLFVAEILKEKDNTDWEQFLKKYERTQKRLFKISFDDVELDEADDVRKLLTEITQYNNTLVDMCGPFHKKLSEETQSIQKAKKVRKVYSDYDNE